MLPPLPRLVAARPAAVRHARLFASSLPALRRWDKLVLDPEVEDALESNKPVVALETAILTHGMPFPLNLDVTLSLSKIIRDAGAVPATIGLLSGVPHVGLSRAQLARLADPAFPAVKVSRRDLAPAMSLGRDGGTTVAGTMWLARQAGVDVFVTGGIGGVHRDGHNTLDVSADLTELGRTPLAVVCAGCKSILDIGRTIEYLETQGVTVATLGETTDFPAFYTPRSGFQAPWNVRSTDEAAAMIHTALHLPTPLASLLAVPIPAEWAPAGEQVQACVEQAVRESVEQGVSGKEATPWLLARVAELTKGSSVKSNIALIQNNARVGAEVAVKLAALKRASGERRAYEGGHVIPPAVLLNPAGGQPMGSALPFAAAFSPAAPAVAGTSGLDPAPAALVVVGAAAVDLTTRPAQAGAHASVLGVETTVAGRVGLSAGGVGLNVALCAHRLSPAAPATVAAAGGAGERGGAVVLIAPVGEDAFGALLARELGGLGMRTDGLVGAGAGGRTAVCSLVLDREGGLEGGVADMGIVETLEADAVIAKLRALSPALVALDANLSPPTVADLLAHCAAAGIPTAFEPTSVPKALRVLPHLRAGGAVGLITPNLLELRALYGAVEREGLMEDGRWWEAVEGLGLGESWRSEVERWARGSGVGEWVVKEGVVQMLTSLSPFFQTQLVKLGPKGCISLRVLPPSSSSHGTPSPRADRPRTELAHGRLRLAYHPATALPAGEVNTTGAGDSLVGAVLAGLATAPKGAAAAALVEDEGAWARVVERGQRAARASLVSANAVGDVGGPGWEL